MENREALRIGNVQLKQQLKSMCQDLDCSVAQGISVVESKLAMEHHAKGDTQFSKGIKPALAEFHALSNLLPRLQAELVSLRRQVEEGLRVAQASKLENLIWQRREAIHNLKIEQGVFLRSVRETGPARSAVQSEAKAVEVRVSALRSQVGNAKNEFRDNRARHEAAMAAVNAKHRVCVDLDVVLRRWKGEAAEGNTRPQQDECARHERQSVLLGSLLAREERRLEVERLASAMEISRVLKETQSVRDELDRRRGDHSM